MVDIRHRVGVAQTSPKQVYDALTTLDGLRAWWVEAIEGRTGPDGVTEFWLGEGGARMDVVQSDPGVSVRWDVVEGPEEWVGTSVQWDLRQEDDRTIVLLTHANWREPVEFMHHCSTKWAIFSMSLKRLLESGEGAPSPRDVKIDDWD